jgi:hypothetical protein
MPITMGRNSRITSCTQRKPTFADIRSSAIRNRRIRRYRKAISASNLRGQEQSDRDSVRLYLVAVF